MADKIDYRLFGTDMQLVEIVLDQGESVQAEVGSMVYMTPSIEMSTNSGGSLWQGVKRKLVGESFFITSFTQDCSTLNGTVAFGAPFPGRIVPLELSLFNGSFLCQRNSFLCCAKGIEVTIAFTKRIGSGLFGGEGFILQRLSGDGLAFIHAGGTLLEKNLDAGETLLVDTGSLVGFSETVDYSIKMISGISNLLFSREGLFLTKLTGPGIVYLQSLPFSRLADRINSTNVTRSRSKKVVDEN
jgi:uncharacterized protein (TIGR00266 family)